MVLLCFPSSGGKKKQVLLGFRSSEQKKKHCKYNVFVILWFGGKNKCVWGLFRLNQKELASMARIGLVASDRVEGFIV